MLERIWNGESKSRPGGFGSIDRAPDSKDWDELTRQVVATQTAILNLASNVGKIPNLPAILEAETKKLDALRSQIASLTVPNNDEIQATIAESKEYSSKISNLLKMLLHVSKQMEGLRLDIEKRLNAADEHMETFESSVRQQIDRLVKSNGEQVSRLDSRVQDLYTILGWSE